MRNGTTTFILNIYMLGPFTSSVGRVLPVLFARRIQTLATTYRAIFGADEILASDRVAKTLYSPKIRKSVPTEIRSAARTIAFRSLVSIAIQVQGLDPILLVPNLLRRSFEVERENLQAPHYRHRCRWIANPVVTGLVL